MPQFAAQAVESDLDTLIDTCRIQAVEQLEWRSMPDPTQRPPKRPPKEPLIKIPESEIRVPPPEQLPPKPDDSPEIQIPPGNIRRAPVVPPPSPEDRAA